MESQPCSVERPGRSSGKDPDHRKQNVPNPLIRVAQENRNRAGGPGILAGASQSAVSARDARWAPSAARCHCRKPGTAELLAPRVLSQCLARRQGLTAFDAGDVAAQKSRTFFDISCESFFSSRTVRKPSPFRRPSRQRVAWDVRIPTSWPNRATLPPRVGHERRCARDGACRRAA